MHVIKVKGHERQVYLVDDGKCHLKGQLKDVAKVELSNKNPILLLDDDHYFNLSLRDQLINKELRGHQIVPENIISPMEAIAAYASMGYKQYDDFCVLTIGTKGVSQADFKFEQGIYMPKGYVKDIGIEFNALIKQYLKIDHSKIEEFVSFLKEKGDPSGDESNEQVVAEFISQLDRTGHLKDGENKILSISNNNYLWRHITISDLKKIRDNIRLKTQKADHAKIIFWGYFSAIFNDMHDPNISFADVLGATHVNTHKESLYPHLPYSIAMEVYCYPKFYKAIIYEAESPYLEYSKPKKIKLFNTGRLTFLRDDQPIRLEMKQKFEKPELMEISVQLDGNQNLLITAGQDQYLLNAYE